MLCTEQGDSPTTTATAATTIETGVAVAAAIAAANRIHRLRPHRHEHRASADIHSLGVLTPHPGSLSLSLHPFTGATSAYIAQRRGMMLLGYDLTWRPSETPNSEGAVESCRGGTRQGSILPGGCAVDRLSLTLESPNSSQAPMQAPTFV